MSPDDPLALIAKGSLWLICATIPSQIRDEIEPTSGDDGESINHSVSHSDQSV